MLRFTAKLVEVVDYISPIALLVVYIRTDDKSGERFSTAGFDESARNMQVPRPKDEALGYLPFVLLMLGFAVEGFRNAQRREASANQPPQFTAHPAEFQDVPERKMDGCAISHRAEDIERIL